MKCGFALSVLVTLFFDRVQAADILLLSTVPSKSHARWYEIISHLLANNGHKVTLLTTEVAFKRHRNITRRVIRGAYDWLDSIEKSIEGNPDILEQFIRADSLWDLIAYLTDPSLFGCDTMIKSQDNIQFKNDYKYANFDLIISDAFCECFYGYVHHFDYPPLIISSPYFDTGILDVFGMYNNPSYVPGYINLNKLHMNFFERLHNAVVHGVSYVLLEMVYYKAIDNLNRDLFGEEVPGVQDIVKRSTALSMVGYNPALHGSKPIPPSVIPVAGLSMGYPSKTLPQDIKKFLDSSDKGAILFSLGSNFKSVLMSPSKRNMITEVFKQLPQKIIWKLEDNVTDLPANVMIKPRLPQSDILGHPNIILFITHGGHNGILEAVHHGVPLLGLPIMFDQVHNLKKKEKMGVAVKLEYTKLRKNSLLSLITKMTEDDSYRRKMKELSVAFRSQIQTPQETFLYWVDRVLQDSTAMKYFRSESENLYWFQRTLLDVFAFAIFFSAAVLIILYKLFKMICSNFKTVLTRCI